MFATNWDEARVDAAGLAFHTLQQQYTRLVYVLLSPWGPLAKQSATMPTPLRQGSDLSAFFGASMLSDVLGAGAKLSCGECSAFDNQKNSVFCIDDNTTNGGVLFEVHVG